VIGVAIETGARCALAVACVVDATKEGWLSAYSRVT